MIAFHRLSLMVSSKQTGYGYDQACKCLLFIALWEMSARRHLPGTAPGIRIMTPAFFLRIAVAFFTLMDYINLLGLNGTVREKDP
jgi:hypothetical protein